MLSMPRNLTLKDFVLKAEDYPSNRKGKRQYLNETMTGKFTKRPNDCFRTIVNVPRIMRGERQELETLINEEALLFAEYMRNEKKGWSPRMGITD